MIHAASSGNSLHNRLTWSEAKRWLHPGKLNSQRLWRVIVSKAKLSLKLSLYYSLPVSLLLIQTGCSFMPADAPVEDRAEQPQPRLITHSPQRQVLISPLQKPTADEWDSIEQDEPAAQARAWSQPIPGDLNPAVVALLQKANRAEKQGDLVRSADNLERALRIQADNAWLWHRLALVRLFQRQHLAAVNMATRSNTLAHTDRRLQSDNWRVIAQAEERRGNPAAADRAARKARALERGR